MDRRSFIKRVAVIGAVSPLAVRAGLALGTDEASLAPPDVVLVTGDSPGGNTRLAIEALGGMKRFVGRRDRVIVKPNIGWDRTPEQAADTNPEVVAALVTACLEAGAKEVKVLDNTCNDPRRCYRRSGIEKAAREAGADVGFVDDRDLVKVRIGGAVIREWKVFRDFVEADKLINVPVAKQHSLAGLSLGMKNWLGAIGGRRNALHQKLNEAIVDLASFFKPVLTVVDGYRVIVRNGPQAGSLDDVVTKKKLVAGMDPVAVDALAAGILGWKTADLPYLDMAASRGMGQADPGRVKLRELEAS